MPEVLLIEQAICDFKSCKRSDNIFAVCLVFFFQKMIKQKQGVDNVNIGANPSAEEADEGVDEAAVEEGLDIVLINRLKETAFGSKKDFMNYWKAHFAWYTSSRY